MCTDVTYGNDVENTTLFAGYFYWIISPQSPLFSPRGNKFWSKTLNLIT